MVPECAPLDDAGGRSRPRRKICCVASSLAAGGAERVQSLLANQWVRECHEVTFVTLAGTVADAYQLDPRVNRIALDCETESRSVAQAVLHNLKKIRGLRRAIASCAPDVVISFVDKVNVLALISCMGIGVPVIISERTHPLHFDIGRIWSLLRRLTYPRTDALVIQSEATRDWAEVVVPKARIRIIPNPVGRQFSTNAGNAFPPRRSLVLGVGRLSQEKGFDVLIQAFSSVAERHPDWSLTIIGEGARDAEWKALARELLPPQAIHFAGTVKDPERYYRVAGLFVLPSRFEGFPNALLEAMACGCAVIATDSPGGTSVIVRNGVDGVLIPPGDVEALAREMDRLMADGVERTRLGERAVEVSSRFGIDAIAALWEGVITDAVVNHKLHLHIR